MDPNATYRRWKKATTYDEKAEAWQDLMEWLSTGGFEPKWTPEERTEFMTWAD